MHAIPGTIGSVPEDDSFSFEVTLRIRIPRSELTEVALADPNIEDKFRADVERDIDNLFVLPLIAAGAEVGLRSRAL